MYPEALRSFDAATLGVLAATVALISIVNFMIFRRRNIDGPLFAVSPQGRSGFHSVSEVLEYTYPKFQDRVYRLRQHYGDIVVIPAKFVEALQAAPESLLSFQFLARERFFARYTLLVSMVDHPDNNTLIKSIKNNLNKSLDWKAVFPAHSLLPVIASCSGRVFVGKDLNRNPEFLDCILNFTIDSMMGGEKLRQYPSFIRNFVQWWIPELQRSRAKLKKMMHLLGPVLEVRKGVDHVSDMLSWNVANSPSNLKHNLKYQAHNQLIASAAAIHTTNMQLSHALFDLAAYPEYQAPLREEVQTVLRTEPNGVWTKSGLAKLRKLDSFLKESQRMNPLGLLTFERRVMNDITLPDGVTIPKGYNIGCPTSSIAKDSALWDNPNTFEAFRFERLRQQPGCENKHQFVTTGIDSLYFGHGKHACPGRFLADAEIKLILINLILHYDCKLPDGTSRPANVEMNSGVMADPTKTILLKRRSNA
uniref:Ent-kaurene oxidase n=1 Tax=Talaromyces marneffei PM1 TaxID=1077442 RepID=A0A093VCQ8_TALMA